MARLNAASTVDGPFQLDDEEDSINRPQRELLCFRPDTALLAPHLADLVLEIQRVAEGHLFHWKTFPLCLPRPLAVQELNEGSASTRRKALIVASLFDLPAWDDLEAVAVDQYGEAKRLSSKQLASARQHGLTGKSGSWRSLTSEQLQAICLSGTFTVPSMNFSGQHHTWRLSPLLMQGSQPARDSLRKTLAWAAVSLRLVAVERFTGDIFSVRQSAHSLRHGLHHLLDLVFGMPSLQPHDFEARLHEERSRYLVAELLCAVDCQEEYMTLCRFIRHLMAHQHSGRSLDLRQNKAPPLPFIFQTPKGLLVDLRLFSREIMDRAKPLVNAVLQAESKARLTRHHSHPIQSERKLAEACCVVDDDDAAEDDEALNRIWESIAAHPDVEHLGPGVGQLLVDQARATVAMKRAAARVRRKLAADLNQAEADLRLLHPRLSLVKQWMDRKLGQVREKLANEYQWKCHEEAIEACRRQSLDQFAYFLSRDLAFLRDRAPMLSKELLADKQATRNFLWDTWIWNPRSWVVRRHFQGHTEVVQTHLSSSPTSITDPRTGGGERGGSVGGGSDGGSGIGSGGQEHPVFSVERSSRRTTTTHWPLWRWANYLQRAWSWSWNGAYACGYLVPWCSPIGLRALVSPQPFYADLELSQVNGALCPRRSAYTATLSSRLSSLWRHISKSRTEFETKPDTGFMGKGLTRQVDRLWNYGVKGLLCSLLLLIVFPAVCILCTIGGACLGLTAPIWAPVLALLYHVCMIFIWDVDNPDPQSRGPLLPLIRVLGRDLLIDGILQPIACLITAVFLCPLVSLVLSLCGLTCWALSRSRDLIVYNLVIRPRGRVPATEGCLVRRIAGPGLNNEFHYRISKEQALAAFEARMEADRLIAYRRQTERLIRRPLDEFRLFVQQVFSPFCAGVPWASSPVSGDKTTTVDRRSESGPSSSFKANNVAVQLERETQALLASLEEKVERRLYELRMPLAVGVLNKIRLTSSDLKLVLARSAVMLRSFYPAEVLTRLGVGESELWERYNVEEGDWLALTAILLGEIFGQTILSPLAEGDMFIQLQAKDVNLSRYGAMFLQTDLDIKEPFDWPMRISPQQPFSLPDFSHFSPLIRDAAHSSPPWKRKRTPQQSAKRLTLGGSGKGSDWSDRSSGTADEEPGRHTPRWHCELIVPLPIPHPVLICLLIYNRHRDVGAIPLESESCRLLVRYLEGGSVITASRSKETPCRLPMAMEAATATRSPASNKPLLGSSGSDLAVSQPSIVAEFTDSNSISPSQHDTLVSMAQDGTLSLVGTLVSEHASVDLDLGMDQDHIAHLSLSIPAESEAVEAAPSKGLGSTLARAADTLRAALLGEKAEEPTASGSSGRNFSVDDFELLPSSDEHLDEQAAGLNASRPDTAECSKRKFPAYQPASFRSWRMNFQSPLRFDSAHSGCKAAIVSSQSGPTSPRPLGLFELSSGLASDRGPAFSPAQLSIGRRLVEQQKGGNLTTSSSQDSLPFAEEDASFVDTPDCGGDLSNRSASSANPRQPHRAFRTIGQPYCEMQQPTPRSTAVLASIEDLSLSLDSHQHTHSDVTSKVHGTQV